MTRFSHFAALAIVISVASACGAAPAPVASQSPQGAASPQQLGHLLERYWDERIAFEEEISPQSLADSLAVEKRFLTELLAIPRDALDANSRLSYDIFRRQRETAIEGFTYPEELLPINPFGGPLSTFPAAADQIAAAPMAAAQYDRWLRGVDVYVRWTRQAITNMQEGILRGYTAPRALIERALPLLERWGTDEPSNVFYAPLRSLPRDMAAGERERLSGSLQDAVTHKLLPAIRDLHDYLLHDYMPKSRAGLSLAELPLGATWYAYRVRRAVGAGALPAEVHRIGLAEVERLKPRLQALREASGVPPSNVPPSNVPPSGVSPSAEARAWDEVLRGYMDLGAQLAANLPVLFTAAVAAPYEIRPLEFAVAPSMPLLYRAASPTHDRSAVLFVNIRENMAKPAIASFLQQALPGRHYQSAIQQQRLDLPRFRRFGAEPAFVDGWGLYAALLGEELGMYPNDTDKYQALNLQMGCAAALVVDTGLHSQGWTRARALEYLHSQMSIADSAAEGLVDAYAAMPGDALSCAMGASKFQALRSRTQQVLGARFDVHEFHTELLKEGAMPLDILETKMNAWLEASR